MLQQNQAKAVFCLHFALNKQARFTCDRDHTHLINIVHVCGYYFSELRVWLLFEGGYYSGCGFYSNKYGILTISLIESNQTCRALLTLRLMNQWQHQVLNYYNFIVKMSKNDDCDPLWKNRPLVIFHENGVLDMDRRRIYCRLYQSKSQA